jgi:predicted kinase
MTTPLVFGGLPGTGRTAIARGVARELNAVYVRIDSIEQAIRASGTLHWRKQTRETSPPTSREMRGKVLAIPAQPVAKKLRLICEIHFRFVVMNQ